MKPQPVGPVRGGATRWAGLATPGRAPGGGAPAPGPGTPPRALAQRPLPEVCQMSVLLQGGLVATETFQEDQPQEVAVLVHDVDGPVSHPEERLIQGKIGGEAL